MELGDDFEYLSGDSSGMLYLSPGIGDVIGVKMARNTSDNSRRRSEYASHHGKWNQFLGEQ